MQGLVVPAKIAGEGDEIQSIEQGRKKVTRATIFIELLALSVLWHMFSPPSLSHVCLS
jgi:hypothetical protein